MKTRGFTLLETLLALMIFSIAVVALVEAVNQLGGGALHQRRAAMVEQRMRSLLVEHTRLPVSMNETKITEEDVTFTIRHEALNLRNQAGLPLQGLVEVRVTAEWLEGHTPHQATTGVWTYPPLFGLPAN